MAPNSGTSRWMTGLRARMYIDYVRKPSAWRYLAVMAPFALGLLAKPMLVTVPLVLLLLDYWPLGRMTRQASLTKLLVEKLPLIAMAIASASITILAQQKAIRSLHKVPMAGRIANACVSYVVYLARLVFRFDLAAFYPYAPRSPLAVSAIGSLLLLLLISTLRLGLTTATSQFAGRLAVVSVDAAAGDWLDSGRRPGAGRSLYVPAARRTLPGCLRFADRRCAAIPKVGAGGRCDLHLGRSADLRLAANEFWRDSRTLWTRALSCTADNWLAHMNLGDALFRVKESDAAVKEFRQAIDLNPHSFAVQNNLGVMYVFLHKPEEAIACFREALNIEPWHAETHTNLGDVFYQKGRLAEAIDEWSEALLYEPDDFIALNMLAWVRATSPEASMRNGKEALDLARRAMELSAGRDPEVIATLAAAYAEEGRFGDAESTLLSAIQLAELRKMNDFAAKLRERLKLYRAGKREYLAR